MKKVILLVAAVMTMSVAANAQFNFGVKAGLNLANMTNSDGAKSLIGLNIGGLAQYKFEGSGFAVQPELLFSMQGAKASEGDGKSALNYINVPIMLQYYVMPGLNVEAGPQIGFLMSAKAKGGGESIDVKDGMNSVDFGINVGAAYQLADMPLGFFARYNIGVSNLAKDLPDNVDGSKNSVFQIGAFWRF